MDLYADIVSALRSGEPVVTATIISGSGSTPVPPGSKMILKGNAGIPAGTIGGGCMEAEIQELGRRLFDGGPPSLLRKFTLTEDDLESGMLCGGNLEILIERLSTATAAVFESLLANRDSGRDALLVTVLNQQGESTGKSLIGSPDPSGIFAEAELRALANLSGGLPERFEEALRESVGRERVLRVPNGGGELVIEPVVGLRDLFIFGGGHVSRFLCRCASMAGFCVTIIDDRAEYANAERFPDAAKTLAVWFDDAWEHLSVRRTSSIVIVTRGHKSDELVLERAVKTAAGYIGMIGSRRKVAATFRNLARRGITEESLRRVHAPIGVEIGAVTAEEIAVSIAAELVAFRRGAASPVSKSVNSPGASDRPRDSR